MTSLTALLLVLNMLTILVNVALVALTLKLYTECQKLRVLRDEE